MTPGLALADKALAMPSSSSVDVVFGQSSVRRGIAPTARGWTLLLVILCVTAVSATWPSAPVIALDAGLVVAFAGAWFIVLSCRSRPGDLHAVLSGPPFVPRDEFALLDAAVVGDVSAWGCSIGIDPFSAKWSRGSQAEPTRSLVRTHLLAPASRHRVAVSAQSLGRTSLVALPVPTSRRGIYECRGVTLWLNDPLGMFGARLAAFSELTVVVHPVVLGGAEVKTDPVLWDELGRNVAEMTNKAGGVDVLGVRPYQQGDRLSSVHWRSLAGTGSLLVRELGDELVRPVQVVIDDRAWVHRRSSFERAVDLLTGAMANWPLMAQSIDLRSLTSGHVVSVSGGLTPNLLRWLAVLEPRETDSPIPNAEKSVLEIGSGDTVFTTATASRSLGSLRERGVRLVVAP
jgi:Protein of unknown function DUF58